MAKQQPINEYPIGTVISDGETPTFETVRIKLKANQDIKPGTLLKMIVSRNEETTLIARVRSGLENDPTKSTENVAVRDAMALPMPNLPEAYNPSAYRLIEADLIEEFYIDETEQVEDKEKAPKKKIRSPQNLPNSGSNVFIADPTDVVQALGTLEQESDGLFLGNTSSGTKTRIVLKKESIQRHFFIGGTTGSGKSYAMGVLAEELIRHGLPVIFIDTQDEYSSFVEQYNGRVVTPGEDFTIRISSLTDRELIEMVPTDSELHKNIISAAFLQLQDARRSREENSFSLDDLLLKIQEIAPSLTNKKDAQDLVLRRASFLKGEKLFGTGIAKANWPSWIHPCLAINCKSLTVRKLQTLVTSLLRELQELRIRKNIPPYVMVIDEAHLFVPQAENSPCKQIIREGVRIGRHHGICMVLMTQSPADIEKTIIRQCNTRMIFALEPDQLDAIKGVKADATDEMLRMLPKMPQGTCLISGTYESIKHTIPVKIRPRNIENSEGGKTPDIFSEMTQDWIPKIHKSDHGEK